MPTWSFASQKALCALLGDGSRWGLRLHWHVVKDPARPHALLTTFALRQMQRIVVGHPDRCPSVAMLLRLAQAEQVLLDFGAERGPEWSRWASIAPESMRGQATDLPRAEFGVALQAHGVRLRLNEPGNGLALRSAAALHQAQPGAGEETWRRRHAAVLNQAALGRDEPAGRPAHRVRVLAIALFQALRTGAPAHGETVDALSEVCRADRLIRAVCSPTTGSQSASRGADHACFSTPS